MRYALTLTGILAIIGIAVQAHGSLILEANLDDGALTIIGTESGINGYSISSASGSLIADDDGNASPFQFYLSNTSNLVDAGTLAPVDVVDSLALDAAFDTSGTEDLVFQYGTSEGTITGGVSYIPEPGSLALLGLGGLAMAVRRRKHV